MTDYRNTVGKSSTGPQTGALDYGQEDQHTNDIGDSGGVQVTATSQPDSSGPSAQVMTVAHNPETGEQDEFPTPQDVPEGWVQGEYQGDGSQSNSSQIVDGIDNKHLAAGVAAGAIGISML